MFGKIERFVTELETAPMSVVGWLAGAMGVVWIRYLLESFSSPNMSGYLFSDLPTLLHYTLFYFGAVTMTVVCVSVATKLSPLHMMRALVFMLPIVWLAPLIDLLRGGARMAYIYVATPGILFTDFLTYFGPFTGTGITFGLRVELGLLTLMLGAYVYIHTRRLSTAIIGAGIGYTVIFIAVAVPSLIAFFLPPVASGFIWASSSGSAWAGALQSALVSHDFLHPSETYSVYRTAELLFNAMLAQVWYLIIFFFGTLWLYLVRKDIVRATLRNIRPERLAHFLIAALLGGLIVLAEGANIDWTILNLITIAVAALTITFAWMFAVIVNDIADESIDAVSNRERPLITGTLAKDTMRDAGFVVGLMALVGALTLGSYATFWILVFSAAYYIYSVPPLRLKRVPILASALIGIATLAIMMFGFFLLSANKIFAAFPPSIALLVVLFMTLLTNVRDIKDIQGDAAAGIWTLPTLLGDRLSRAIIGILVFIAYASVPLLFPIQILWIPSLIVGAVSWIGLVRGKGERFIFILYFLYLASIVLLLRFA